MSANSDTSNLSNENIIAKTIQQEDLKTLNFQTVHINNNDDEVYIC